MIRFAIVLVALLAVIGGARVYAQDAPPTPPADPLTYTDPAMTFTAPAGSVLLGRIGSFAMSDLGNDLQTVATWAIAPGKEDQRLIQLQMEAYSGQPSEWEGQFESQTHGATDGTLIRNKIPMALLNGMPATYVEVAFGSGFDARKQYAIVWADGQRGIVLSEITRMGQTSADEARRLLKQVTAVRYPLYQP